MYGYVSSPEGIFCFHLLQCHLLVLPGLELAKLHRQCQLDGDVFEELHFSNFYCFTHNDGSGKWLYLKGNDPIGGTHFSLP